MAELAPYPFAALALRMFRELERDDAIFDLPAKKFVLGSDGRDYSAGFHEKRPATPLGPAAGPHTQMAQNIVLSFLAGCRVMELKTVQINDRLEVLETKVLYQDRTIDELNEVVTKQQDQIDLLLEEVKRLRDVLQNAPDSGIEGGEEPPPPHY